MDLVSAIIPTYNRFKYLLNTIQSIKAQTYKNIEIIAVNDCSTEKEYYEYNWEENGVTMIHLDRNSREIFGYVSIGYTRNRGIEQSSGKYIAFCDDDDMWFPSKIEKQLDAMKKTGCKMSSTEGLIGTGVYDSNKGYKKYITEHYVDCLKNEQGLLNYYKYKGYDILENGFPEIFNLEFMSVNNSMIVSSVIMEKELLEKIDNMRHLIISREDYDCWLRALEHTDSVFVKDVCIYYDAGHGDGQDY
jgi:glycosyltransferase involved in cell wall biosynthesis